MTATLTVAPGESPDLLTSMDVIREAGITYRQLDFWHRCRLLKAEREWRGSGSVRYWSKAEARVARDIGRLVRAGFELHKAAEVARSAEPRVEVAPGIWLELGPPLSPYCERGDCEGCFPEEPGGCGHGCHDDEQRGAGP